ncbi:Anaphase-promoting complex subunit 10 [Talaromyces islandicus]|uniref:Anaphase-promoting complex subunit 10 n=1 Tax=Talaromyces islandicus TaxID=28573 RepID=A0A0U1M1L0_TALIS|nr:Anaphase-promoting complex subunit 10 [Talaromyces islandicus]
MPRQVPRRTQPDPSTPVTGAPQHPQHQHEHHQRQRQPPPVRTATTGAPVFETPPGFQFPPDAIHPRRGVETLVGTLPTWQLQPPPQRQPAGLDTLTPAAAAGHGREGSQMSELGDTTEGDENNFDLEGEFNSVIDHVDGDEEDVDEGDEDVVVEEEEEEEEDEEDEDEDEEMHDRDRSASPPPPELREISSLASWTVSTHKPGCGVAALRSPSPEQFWQSDGPQPHTLTLNFFKRVAIVKLRVYLDFVLDESYTPTKMIFLAGMGGNDLVEFSAWEGESPRGWVDISLEGVGGRHRKSTRDSPIPRRRQRQRQHRTQKTGKFGNEDDSDGLDDDYDDDNIDPDDPFDGNVLKAMVLQVRICENHQNGKDTHVRGFQVFAYDEDRRRVAAAAAAAAAAAGQQGQSPRKSIRKNSHGELSDATDGQIHGLEEPDWMGEPVIR